jgi:hypothetical protein
MDTNEEKKVGRPSNAEKLAKVHAASLAAFDRAYSAAKDVREACTAERRFYSVPGAQWEGEFGEQYANKAKLEVNKCHLAVIRIFSEYRNNRIGVQFEPNDGQRGPAVDKLIDTCGGLLRADERDSGAEEAYDNAFEEAVGGGMGAWRLRACYEDELDDENDRQRIAFEPIPDADQCVFFDADCKRQDKKGAREAWVLTGYTHAAFEDEFGHSPSTWPAGWSAGRAFNWATPQTVYVAEHYKVEHVSQKVQIWESKASGDKKRFEWRDDEDGEGAWVDTQTAEELEPAALRAQGFVKKAEKTVKRQRVRKYIESGLQVEEDCGLIAGTEIPIVVVYGKRWFVDGVEHCQGHTRTAQDSQRLANMLRSKVAEIAARSSEEKPILTPEQIKGHAGLWQNDGTENYPYLLLNPIADATGQQVASGPVGYTKPPAIPPAIAALWEGNEADLRDLLGNQQAGEEVPNLGGVSGKAVELVQNRLDMQSFLYVSNLAKAHRRSGEIWLGMARDLYAEEGRKMKTVSPDGKAVGSATLNGRPLRGPDGREYRENDVTRATFGVAVDVGPSSSSQRAATVRGVTGLRALTTDPEMSAALEGIALMNMEGEGLADVREWSRKRLVRMGVMQPTEEEARALADAEANAQPTAQDQYLMAEAGKAEADSALKRAQTVKTMADAELSDAKTVETLAGIGRADSAHELNVGKAMHEAGRMDRAPMAPGAQ